MTVQVRRGYHFLTVQEGSGSLMPNDDLLPVNVPAKTIPGEPVTAPAVTAASRARQAFRRDRITWTCYLALALFTYFLSIQGNIIPFLRDELALSYREVSLHPAALAAGLIVCGLLGERVVAWCGRRGALALGFAGICGGAVLLSLAHTVTASIAGCLLMGAPGGLILVVVPALLAERHGALRSVAFGEANAASYFASLTATVAMGSFTAIGLDWRYGLVLGIALTAVALASHAGDPIPAARPAGESGVGRLPAAYWAYWATLFCVIALEFCTLLWSPEVLERVQGLSRASAAAMAAGFSAAMLIGRLFIAPLLRHVSAQRLFAASLALTLPGLALYIGVRQPVPCVVGLVVVGLGTAPLYPLTLGFAIGVAGRQGEVASARASLASGLAILIMPMALGALADGLGLRLACLFLPVLTAVAALCFVAARALERRASNLTHRSGGH
ncbi:MFS transporter [Telmatospirillum sp.]|uniref:MFS transporter n=1 Tax=Telmatospirillum sp. TaxID=2079197 RepID=UPI002841B9FB|nr:MFS transporter [Telmatospirillum sp.]MDR3437238.1 MFS transporter [Telmatospirillum sp.]